MLSLSGHTYFSFSDAHTILQHTQPLPVTMSVTNAPDAVQALRDSTATLTDKARLVEELTDANSKLQQEARSVDSLADENADLREEVGRLNSCTVLLEAKVLLLLRVRCAYAAGP